MRQLQLIPRTSIAYQTEDRDDGLIYKFIPNVKTKYAKGGKLQALIIKDDIENDTRNWDKVNYKKNIKYNIDWLDLDSIDNPKDDMRYRAAKKGAAVLHDLKACGMIMTIYILLVPQEELKRLGKCGK